MNGGSFGKGSTAEQGEASALMEAIERYSGIFQGDEIRVTRRFTDFAPGDAILPNDVLLFSDAQYRRASGADRTTTVECRRRRRSIRSAEIEWSPVWSLRDERFKYLPTSLLYFFYRGASPGHIHADSNGCAAGNTLEEAIVQGFLELVERDSYAIWWYNRLQAGGSGPQPVRRFLYPRSARSSLPKPDAGFGCSTSPAISVFRASSRCRIRRKTDKDFIEFGSGSHFDARIAMLRALTELNQFLSIGLMGLRSGEIATRTTPIHGGCANILI